MQNSDCFSATGIFLLTEPDGTKKNVYPIRSENGGWEWFTINANSGGGFQNDFFGK